MPAPASSAAVSRAASPPRPAACRRTATITSPLCASSAGRAASTASAGAGLLRSARRPRCPAPPPRPRRAPPPCRAPPPGPAATAPACRRGGQHVRQHRAAADGVQHLGQVRAHAHALAGGQNDDQVRLSAHRAVAVLPVLQLLNPADFVGGSRIGRNRTMPCHADDKPCNAARPAAPGKPMALQTHVHNPCAGTRAPALTDPPRI